MKILDAKTRHVQLSETLHSQLCGSSGKTTVWLALDGAARPIGYERTESECSVEAGMKKPGAITVALAHEQIDRQWCPTWVPLDLQRASDGFLLQDSVEFALDELDPNRLHQGYGRRVAGWLEVQGNGRSSAVRIATKMIQRTTTGLRRLLRLHDPAVLWGIWPLLLQEQQAAWFGEIESWRLLDPSGNLVLLKPPPIASVGVPLTAGQWVDIENITPMNQTLRACLQRSELGTADALERVRIVAAGALRRARRLGFTDTSDLALFAEHAVLVNPEFDLHDLVRDVLDRRKPGDHYSALIDSLTDEDWSKVRGQVPRSSVAN